MTAEDFAAPLTKAKRVRDGQWMACCPAHEDREPSLSVTDGEKGVVVRCFSGCTVEDIAKARGIAVADLFYDRRESRKPERPRVPPLTNEQVAEMARALAEDQPAMEHVTEALRFDPEVVRALSLGLVRDGDGRRWLAYPYKARGAWTFANMRSLDGPKDFRRFPSGQPTTLYLGDGLRDGGTAILVEGEKDAVAATTMGLGAEVGGSDGCAIVALPGAEQWKAMAQALRSQRRVYVALDADEVGDKAAAGLIQAIGQRGVRVRPPEGKDFADILAAHGPEAGLQIVLSAIAEADGIADDGSSYARMEKMARSEYDPPPLVPTGLTKLDHALLGGLPLNKLTVIAARTSHGKTATAVRLAVNMALGGRDVRVIWCEDEATEFDLRALSILSGTPFSSPLDKDGVPTHAENVLAAYRAKQVGRIWARVPGHKREAWRKHCRTFVLERPTPEQIADMIDQERESVFILDHLGELNWGDGRKHELIGDGLRLIRAAAVRRRCLFVAMTQLNREWDRRKAASDNPMDVRPALSDIENSGQIEQVARVCIIAEKVMMADVGGELPSGEYRYHIFKPRLSIATVRWHDELAVPDNEEPMVYAAAPAAAPSPGPALKPVARLMPLPRSAEVPANYHDDDKTGDDR